MAYDEIAWGVNEIKKKIADSCYPPRPMRSYNVVAGEGGIVNLYFTPPSNTYLSDSKQIPLVEVAGIDIRKSTSPINSLSDGELLVKISAQDMHNYEKTPYVDSDVEIGTTYYYRFFPYSTLGRYNTNDISMHSVTVSQEGSLLVFGFDQDFRDLNQETNLYYPSDVANYGYTPMSNNTEGEDLDFGGWEHFVKNILKNAPYMVLRDGKADYALDPDDLTMKLNGETSDWNNMDYLGMPMAWLNKIYKKEWYTEEGNVRHVRFCEGIPFDANPDDWEAVGFYYGEEESPREGLWLPMCWSRAYREPNQDDTTIHFMTNKTKLTSDDHNEYIMEKSISELKNPVQIVETARRFCSTLDKGQSVAFGYDIIPILRDLMWMMCRTTNTKDAMINSDRLFFSYILSPQNDDYRLLDPHLVFKADINSYLTNTGNYSGMYINNFSYNERIYAQSPNYSTDYNSEFINNNKLYIGSNILQDFNIMHRGIWYFSKSFKNDSVDNFIYDCIRNQPTYINGITKGSMILTQSTYTEEYKNSIGINSGIPGGTYPNRYSLSPASPTHGDYPSQSNGNIYNSYTTFYRHSMVENHSNTSHLYQDKGNQQATNQLGISSYIKSMNACICIQNNGLPSKSYEGGLFSYLTYDLPKWAECYDATKSLCIGDLAGNKFNTSGSSYNFRTYYNNKSYSFFINNSKNSTYWTSNSDGTHTGWAIMILPPIDYSPEG